FADQGIETVGLDAIRIPLEQFFTEHNMEWEESDAPTLGPDAKLFSSKADPIKLYCGDIVNFSVDVAGQFDAVWDRGSISAINREDVDKYVNLMKNLVKPGGRIIMEVVQYDVSIMDDVDRPSRSKPPPPFPLFEEDLNRLYGPEFSVQFLEREGRKLAGKDIEQSLFLLIKN
ncbi:thiopurine S-methyltransferase, partial [Elysia marginata]